MKRVGYLIGAILVIVAASLIGMLVHEGGHTVVALAYGGKVTYVEILTGFKLYPGVELVPWTRSVARVGFDLPKITKFQSGFLALAGSGATAFLSYLALAIGWKQRGLAKLFWLWLAGLMAIDIVTYSLLPLIGLDHWVFVGGGYPEPYYGARAMGVPAWVYFPVIVAHALLSGWLVYQAIRKEKN